ncbi:MAG: FAD:protein FMN transferase [Marinobacter sp.]|nr:FAD:protein FMN transferase [Marinobacter sp.]
MTVALFRLPLLLALALLLTACSQSESQYKRSTLEGRIFGTFYQIIVIGPYSDSELDAFRVGLRQVMDEVDMSMSTYKPDSELMRFNRAPLGEWVQVSPGLFTVLEKGQQVAQASDGAFDMTVGGLVNLWSFGPEARPTKRPDAELLAERLAQTGYQYLELDPETRSARRLRDALVDLSGIAKGYAVDELGRWLDAQGVEHYMVNLGGDLIARGERAPGVSWRVGIEMPDSLVPEAKYAVPLKDLTVATSGDYRNYFEHEGVRYSHTIDPQTGEPIQHNLASVSMFHESNTLADAWATALMVVGPGQAQQLALANDLMVVLLERNNGDWLTWVSPAYKARLGPLQ